MNIIDLRRRGFASGAAWTAGMTLLAVLAGCTTPSPGTPVATTAAGGGGKPAAAPAAYPSTAGPGAMAAPSGSAAPTPTAAPAGGPPPIMPFADAVLFAANAMFKSASTAVAGDAAVPLVIDPLIDGNSGMQSVATQSMESRVSQLVRSAYPKFDLQPFSTATLARGPLLFIGTFTAVDKDGKNLGHREWYRVCLALLDLRSGKIVAKGFARSSPDAVDTTPTAFFQDSPGWAPDAATEGYVKTCQGTKAGDPINAAYWDKIVAAALVNDATLAYNAGHYDEALDLYRGVSRLAGGDQLRVYNGIYLSAWKLGHKDEAAQAFSKLVDYGIARKRLGVKFLFRPGSTLFITEQQVAAPYPVWIKQIASRSRLQKACMEIAGHTSRTGAEPINERLSKMRAAYVQQRLVADTPALAARTRAIGKGSQENITGLGTDDARDALDRRVEFKVVDCAAG